MSDHTYVIEISGDELIETWELDELRQMAIDYLSPSEGTVVSISQVD